MKLLPKLFAIVLSLFLAFAFVSCAKNPVEDPNGDVGDDIVEDEKPVIDDIRAPFYVLVIGNDSRVGTIEATIADYADGNARSDTMILVRVDPVRYLIALISIPRDTTAIVDGYTIKINEVYRRNEPEALVREVSLLTGVVIDYYMDMGFVDFKNFVDAFGGIEANVPLKMSWRDIVTGEMISLSAGFQALDAAGALVLARVRSTYAVDIDACRQVQNRQIVQVAIEKVLKNPLEAIKHVNALTANMRTNWEVDDMTKVIASFISNSSRVKFVSGSGPYAGDFDPNLGGLWVIHRDEAKWRELIQTIESGGDPTTIIPLPDVRAA